MDTDTLQSLSSVLLWVCAFARLAQVAFVLPRRARRWGVVDLLQPLLFLACFFFAVTLFALGNGFLGGLYSALGFWEFWQWWNDDDNRRRRKKLLTRIKRRVALVAGRTKVVEA